MIKDKTIWQNQFPIISCTLITSKLFKIKKKYENYVDLNIHKKITEITARKAKHKTIKP